MNDCKIKEMKENDYKNMLKMANLAELAAIGTIGYASVEQAADIFACSMTAINSGGNKNDTRIYMVNDSEGLLIGLCITQKTENKKVRMINLMVVRHTHRLNGVGSMIVNHVKDVESCDYHCLHSCPKSLVFWQSMGFNKYGLARDGTEKMCTNPVEENYDTEIALDIDFTIQTAVVFKIIRENSRTRPRPRHDIPMPNL